MEETTQNEQESQTITPPETTIETPTKKDRSGMAITGFVFGILSLLLGLIGGIPAIIFSAIGLRSKKRGLAIAGLVLGIVSFVISIMIIIILGSLNQARNAALMERALEDGVEIEVFDVGATQNTQ